MDCVIISKCKYIDFTSYVIFFQVAEDPSLLKCEGIKQIMDAPNPNNVWVCTICKHLGKSLSASIKSCSEGVTNNATKHLRDSCAEHRKIYDASKEKKKNKQVSLVCSLALC